MGYPMTWDRFCRRNNLAGTYTKRPAAPGESDEACSIRSMIAGDLRRIEDDQRDDAHLTWYAEKTGVTKEQARAVLDLFFDHDSWVSVGWRAGLNPADQEEPIAKAPEDDEAPVRVLMLKVYTSDGQSHEYPAGQTSEPISKRDLALATKIGEVGATLLVLAEDGRDKLVYYPPAQIVRVEVMSTPKLNEEMN